MSHPRSPFIEDHRDDGIATECWLCHGYIHAGTYPAICKDCMWEFEIGCEFNRMAREFNKMGGT